jgi:hypothetical protein
MLAKDLKPGDIFRLVGKPDPESLTRVCLTNDREYGIRFGWGVKENGLTDHSGYWCYMGELCEVELVKEGS